jgi:hypothetical protein
MQPIARQYLITSDFKKTTYQTEKWKHTLISGKDVILLVTTYFFGGSFIVELTDHKKDDILQKKNILLSDYPGLFVENLDDSCDIFEEVENNDNYTEDEKKEINRLIYCSEDNVDTFDENDQYDVDENVLRENGWVLSDTIYGIDSGCILEPVQNNTVDSSNLIDVDK